MGAKPRLQVIKTASIGAPPLRCDLECGWRGLPLQYRFQALVKAAVVILKRQQKHVALLAFDVTQRAIPARHRNSKIECCPAFACLWLAG